jgi:hypothetical protein
MKHVAGAYQPLWRPWLRSKCWAMDSSKQLSPASGLEILERLARATQQAVETLLGRSGVRYEDINAGGGMFFIGWNKWQWEPVPDDVQPLVGAARHAHDELRDYAAMIFRAGAPDRIDTVDDISEWLLRLIEQPNGTYPQGAPDSSIEKITSLVSPRIDEFLAEAARLPTAHGADERLLVADTSALLDRPDLQDWKLDSGPWTVVLVPQVLSELDERKRDPRTAEAAQSTTRIPSAQRPFRLWPTHDRAIPSRHDLHGRKGQSRQNACSRWHTAGLASRNPWLGHGATVANPSQRPRKPHGQANSNQAPRLQDARCSEVQVHAK